MPVAAPPAPVGQAVLGACDGGADASGPPLLVPAAATQAPLQPAKLAVWRLHAEQVRVGALAGMSTVRALLTAMPSWQFALAQWVGAGEQVRVGALVRNVHRQSHAKLAVWRLRNG